MSAPFIMTLVAPFQSLLYRVVRLGRQGEAAGEDMTPQFGVSRHVGAVSSVNIW
ncbi:hypothetical protein [uncultured Litoreibacter sp.]|uniref:hypothetical protein n=1 Tax=uncultured Litoreibacter sp. TaxID=1392394 RepID=UPI00262A592E|nr:hypothetical protein [uncultured Litoreibacter sp.]